MTNSKEDLNEKTLLLVARAKDGDSEAMDALYRLYQNRLKKQVKKNLGRKLRGRMESADLIQSVWKDVLGNMNGFEYRGHNSFFQWLAVRILRKIQDKGRYFASRKRDIKKERLVADETAMNPDSALCPARDQTPSQVVAADENLNQLMRLLDHLPDPQRQALVLRLRDDLSFDEIAETMNKSPGAVRQLYSRALKKINELKDKGEIGSLAGE